MPDRAGHPRLALASAMSAAVTLIGGWWFAARLQPEGYDPARDSISALAARGAGSAWVMAAALVLTGAAHVVTAWALPRVARPGRVLLAGAGVATMAGALLRLPDPHESSPLHTLTAALAVLGLALWAWFVRCDRLLHRGVTLAACAGALVLGATFAGWLDRPFGVVERVVLGGLVLWPVVTAVILARRAGARWGRAHASAGLRFAATVVACLLAGLTATTMAPVTAQTRHYVATVSLDPNPMAASSLVAPTVFGDIEVSFRGLAPGIRAVPQVKASITDLLGRPGVSISALAPGPRELDAAVRSAGIALGLRFLVGVAVVVVLVVIGSALRRRSRLTWPMVARAVGAGTLAMLMSGASTVLTYRPEQVKGFGSTGVLGTVQANASFFADVEARSVQAAPYLANLVALTSSLQSRYTAASTERPVAQRFLLISDLHDGNQFALVQSLVAEGDIDAVIDTGDLVTFGTVEEGEAAGLFAGIASLDVPYLFVRGNHDATSATDTAILDRLAAIPNVVLLQPRTGAFVEAELGGIRIRGVNDTRWFGDDGTRTAARQAPAIEDYRAAFADRPEPDLLLSHHPAPARTLPAGVRVHGHMHTPFLEGNRIQVGTFTGGGPFTHYVTSEDGAELTGQPSAFDILALGEDCRVVSLTRFRFRNLVEGRPAYDDVTLVNGAAIDDRPPDPDRQCRAGGSIRTLEVPVDRSAPRRP